MHFKINCDIFWTNTCLMSNPSTKIICFNTKLRIFVLNGLLQVRTDTFWPKSASLRFTFTFHKLITMGLSIAADLKYIKKKFLEFKHIFDFRKSKFGFLTRRSDQTEKIKNWIRILNVSRAEKFNKPPISNIRPQYENFSFFSFIWHLINQKLN